MFSNICIYNLKLRYLTFDFTFYAMIFEIHEIESLHLL